MAEKIANVGTKSDGAPDFSKALILAEKPAGNSRDGHWTTTPMVIDAETLGDLHLLHERDQATVADIAELDGQEDAEVEASVKEPTRQVEGVLTGNGDGQWLSGALKLLKESGKTEVEDSPSSQAAVARISQKFFEKVFPEVRVSDKIDYADFSGFLYDHDEEDNVVNLSPDEIQRRMTEDPEATRLQVNENIKQTTDYLRAALTRVQEGRPADGNDSVEEIAKAVEGIVRAQKALESLDRQSIEQGQIDNARTVINGQAYSPLPRVSGSRTESPIREKKLGTLPPIRKSASPTGTEKVPADQKSEKVVLKPDFELQSVGFPVPLEQATIPDLERILIHLEGEVVKNQEIRQSEEFRGLIIPELDNRDRAVAEDIKNITEYIKRRQVG